MRRHIATIRAFVEKYPDAFTEPSVRWIRFNRDTNGFADAFFSIGRRVFVDEDKFFECCDRLNGRSEDV